MKKLFLALLTCTALVSLSFAAGSNMVVGEADKCHLAVVSMEMRPNCRYKLQIDDLTVSISEIDLATEQTIRTKTAACTHFDPMKVHCM